MNYESIRGDKYSGLLHEGQIVESILYGGRIGYIVKIIGEQKPYTVRSLGCGMVTGGNAQIKIRFETGDESTVPECIVRGLQWYIQPEPLNVELVAEYLIQSAQIDNRYNESIKRRALEAKAEAESRARELEELPKQYYYLETVKAYEERTGKNYCSLIVAANNIRKELAKQFPGIKFSVKSDRFSGGDSIDITWKDGPTTKEVDAITEKYNDHATDETGDFRDPTNHVFNGLYGGSKYVMTQRRISAETETALKSWADEQFKNETCFAKEAYRTDTLIWRLVSHYSIPANFKVTGAEHIDGITCGSGVADFYRLTITALIPAEVK